MNYLNLNVLSVIININLITSSVQNIFESLKLIDKYELFINY